MIKWRRSSRGGRAVRGGLGPPFLLDMANSGDPAFKRGDYLRCCKLRAEMEKRPETGLVLLLIGATAAFAILSVIVLWHGVKSLL